ncbi:MAG: hypothetical protein EB078_02710 [Proteobacteria bacterium]|nr:hypothetical protein [Pseudomonadota bacterium]
MGNPKKDMNRTDIKRILLVISLMGFNLPSVAGPRTLPLPEIETVKSTKPSVDEAIKTIYTAASPENRSGEFPRLKFEEDLSGVEVEAIQRIINDSSVPNKEKQITLVRYTLGDNRITQALIDAKNKGIAVKLITDLNPAMKLDFSNKESEFSAAFSKAKLKDPDKNSGAKVIGDLLEAGFVIKKDILSQPLYSGDLERIPIMHEKALLLKSGTKKTVFFGSANLARNPRYNRTYEVEDDAFYDRYQSHVDALTEIYQKGKETKEIADQPRTLIQYPDGSEIELAFTDGKYNPNDRISEILDAQKLNHITLSHFVITHRGFLQALGRSFKKHPEAKGFAIADDRFSSISNGWGLAPTLAGIDITDPFNRRVTGLDPATFRRIESYIYQRPAVDPETREVRKETNEEGPPVARHVWHDKTTLLDYEDAKGNSKSSIFTGSFNLSNNTANSEFQAQINLPTSSWVRKAIDHSIRSVVKKEPQWAVPTLDASLRNAMGIVFGMTDIEVPLDKTHQLMDAIDKRDFDGIKKSLADISNGDTNLHWTVSADVKQKRLEQFVNFLSWYQKNIPPSHAELELRMRRIVGIAMVIGQPEMKDHIKANIMSSVIERPQLSIEEHHHLLDEAFKQLGISDINPWSGVTSKLISIEEIIAPDVLESLSKKPNLTLSELIRQKIAANDFSWKGPAFDTFLKTMKSEKEAAITTILHSGNPTAHDIVDFVDLIRKSAKELEIDTSVQKLPIGHIFSTEDPEVFEKRLSKLWQSHAKKGIVDSEVISKDPVVTKATKNIKSEKLKAMSELKIRSVEAKEQKPESASPTPPQDSAPNPSSTSCVKLMGALPG